MLDASGPSTALSATLFVTMKRSTPEEKTRLVANLWAATHCAPLVRTLYELLTLGAALSAAQQAPRRPTTGRLSPDVFTRAPLPLPRQRTQEREAGAA